MSWGKITSIAVVLGGLIGSPASAADDSDKCRFYSLVGSAGVEYLLPLTLQQVVDMMAGKNDAAMAGLMQALMGAMTGNDLLAASTLSEEEAGLLGEAGGATAFQLLLAGQVTTAEEVKAVLYGTCLQIGPDQIVANQKAANEAEARNLGQ